MVPIFESLTERLETIFQRLKGKGRLTEAEVKEALREIRLALLAADVHYGVVKSFIRRVEERAVGQEVLASLTPGQMVVKIVYEEMVRLLGEERSSLVVSDKPPTIIMLVGLQGAGKTTLAAKLGRQLRTEGHRPLLVAADIYRPAAVRQLEILGEGLGIPVFSLGDASPLAVVKGALSRARSLGQDFLVIDTAGRLQIDAEMMAEIALLAREIGPQERLLVVDAMTGQEAVGVAQAFHQEVGLTGLVLTKMDGDARGGAAISLRESLGLPIKYISAGEKPEALEPFHPDRMASRILGMGDVLSLIEKAQASFDLAEAQRLEQRLKKAEFDFDDFREQLRQLKRLGPLDQVLGMLPGVGPLKKLRQVSIDEKELVHLEAIIDSMTAAERRDPELLDGSRRRRVARGSGTSIQEVNRLLKQFQEMKRLWKTFGGSRKRGRGLPRLPFLQ